jgi:hypothetical protein
MSLSLRPAQNFASLNGPDVDDYDVMDGDRRVGRLYRAKSNDQPWRWSLSSAVAPSGMSGRAVTRTLALQTLSDTYQATRGISRSEDRPRLGNLRTTLSLLSLGSSSTERENADKDAR